MPRHACQLNVYPDLALDHLVHPRRGAAKNLSNLPRRPTLQPQASHFKNVRRLKNLLVAWSWRLYFFKTLPRYKFVIAHRAFAIATDMI